MEEPSARDSAVLTLLAMVSSATLIAQHIAGKATRDALFLTYFPVEQLPFMMMASAALSVIGVLLMSRLLARFCPATLIPVLFLLSAGLLLLQWWMIGFSPHTSAALLYLQIAAVNSLLISGFWSVINERFDPHSAKTVIARVAAAATFGGLAGGLLAKVVSSLADTNSVLLMLAAMHLACGVFVAILGRGTSLTAASAKVGGGQGLIAPLRDSALIRRMAVLALLVATTAAVLDFILKAQAQSSLDQSELISFFSYFYLGVGLGGFLLQSLLGSRALRWFGLGGAMLAWPLVIVFTGSITLVLRSLATVTLLRASANLLYNSFFRTGFELLYTPVPRELKRTGKVMIDVGADRSGDIVGGVLVAGILLVPLYSDEILVVAAVGLASCCALLILVLQNDYTSQLSDNLRTGRLAADELQAQAVDATTLRTLATTQQSIDRKGLLEAITHRQQLRAEQGPDASADRGGAAGLHGEESWGTACPGTVDPLMETILVLRSEDAAAIRRVLASRELSPELVPHALPLMQRDELLQPALKALRAVATRSAGQMVDALLDPLQGGLVRRRIPVVLGYSESPLAVQGLLAVLQDGDRNVRYRAAEAIERIRRRRPHVSIDDTALHEALNLELDTVQRTRATAATRAPEDLEMAFLLIGALDDPDTVRLCWAALRGEDRWLKGTALEYLESRVPGELWHALYPLLGGRQPPQREKKRSGEEAAQALRSAAGRLNTRR